MKYELKRITDISGSYIILWGIDENGREWLIPFDENNTDYQNYLIATDGGLPEPPAEADAPADSTTTK